MPIGFIFWLLMLLWFVFGIWWDRSGQAGGPWGWYGNMLFPFILFFLLGWKAFGFAIHA